MSVSLDIDGQRFHFPDDWQVLKYDDSAFHRNQFQSFAGGAKAVDAVALSPTGECWLIEVKDYRRNRRSKPGSVFAETAGKVRATLAGMATARVRANDSQERVFCDRALHGDSLRVALHLNQPAHASRLFPQVVDPRTALTQFRRELRAVDPHAICCGKGVARPALPWHVA
ncbi:hypothetical protein [Aromatoleum bremense]|uniref:Cysteinyl-tRNA synthetase n=1 Tax=Aromatoleum bremense TaxID=76115 RepID=A0ABX1NWL4_9RHOO|nr:hypothetical protein [Aromatoleum bremense]MCA8917197.1 hypothetical protein [Planctomycetota bacterium]NMG16414.1 hypothetical protein [Aromatoleum bremense]QTQ31622.1 Uncharacterized protein pbN1_16310 [Aromatoleum bremense]